MKTKLFKHSALGILFIFLVVGLTNCDKIVEALTIDSPFSAHFTINVLENDPLTFTDGQVIDLSTDDVFNDNKDKIDYFTLTEVYYKVVGYSGEAGILGSGSITFKNGNTQVGDAITQENVDFKALFDSGDEVVLPLTSNTTNEVQNTLKDEMKITISIEGLVTDKPVYVDVEVFLIVSAKVNP